MSSINKLVTMLFKIKEKEREVTRERINLENLIHNEIKIDLGTSKTHRNNRFSFTVTRPITKKVNQKEALLLTRWLPVEIKNKVLTIKYGINDAELKKIKETKPMAFEAIKRICLYCPGKNTVTVKDLHAEA